MGVYKFFYEPSAAERDQGAVAVVVVFDDVDGKHPFIEYPVQAFEQFLLGLTFQPESIAKVLNLEAVRKNLETYRALSDE